jgi:hypothetical protein
MWEEGASDLWGRLEQAETEREVELLRFAWARLESEAGGSRPEPGRPEREAA